MTKIFDRDCAVLIPTLNRANLLVRQLAFYASLSVPFKIYIVDSTNAKDALSEFAVDFFSKKISIDYQRDSDLNDRQAIWKLITNCEERFCAFSGDDDFLLPEGLLHAQKFLQNNQDYRIAHGLSRLVITEPIANRQVIRSISDYWGAPERAENALAERLNNFCNNYFVPQFSLHRTDEFMLDWKLNADNPSRSFGELQPTFLTIARGKAKFINTPYLIRQSHPARNGVPTHPFNVLRDDNWFKGLELAVEHLSSEISEQLSIGLDESSEMSIKYFRIYFDAWMRGKYGNTSTHSNSFKRFWIDKLPVSVVGSLRILKKKISGNSSKIVFFRDIGNSDLNRLLEECLTLPLDNLLPGASRFSNEL